MFYGVDYVQRQHKYFCRLGNADAYSKYETLHSKDNILSIYLCGLKSGCKKQFNGSNDSLFGRDYTMVDVHQPSILQIRVRVSKQNIDEKTWKAITQHPYSEFASSLDEYAWLDFKDFEAFSSLIKLFDDKYGCIIEKLLKLFVDWKKLDHKKEVISANKIAQQIKAHMYSPQKNFYLKCLNYPWNTVNDSTK